ncbi:MAG: hypothetical protein H7144_14165 [Burkholderiales bacterium]|nr:hypothetical protein [Phycisphaerae bacterium]
MEGCGFVQEKIARLAESYAIQVQRQFDILERQRREIENLRDRVGGMYLDFAHRRRALEAFKAQHSDLTALVDVPADEISVSVRPIESFIPEFAAWNADRLELKPASAIAKDNNASASA